MRKQIAFYIMMKFSTGPLCLYSLSWLHPNPRNKSGIFDGAYLWWPEHRTVYECLTSQKRGQPLSSSNHSDTKFRLLVCLAFFFSVKGKRPFGVSLLYIGWDKHYGFQLYQSDPSGNYGGWKATCIGNNSAVSIFVLLQNVAKGLVTAIVVKQ